MKRRSLSNSAQYHEELSARYNRRKVVVNEKKLRSTLQTLGFDLGQDDFEEAYFGCNNRTYLTNDLAIKIRDEHFLPKKVYKYLASKIVSDHFYPQLPVVHVLAYDHFMKTDYEILVMERGRGKLLIDDFLDMDIKQQKDFYGQIIDLGNQVASLVSEDWGDIRNRYYYHSFANYLTAKVKDYSDRIIEQRLAREEDIKKIEKYFLDRVGIFDGEEHSHFIHTDLTIANVLYEKNQVTLLCDFDSAIRGPKCLMLPMLIASIDNISIVVDGTPYYKSYQNKKFEHLYPVLKEKMGEALDDPNIIEKMNLILIIRGLRIVAENRFHVWNKVIITDILSDELAESKLALDQTYYGQIFQKMGICI